MPNGIHSPLPGASPPATSPTSPPATNPGVNTQPQQGHLPTTDRMITALAESKEGQGLLADVRHFFQTFVCRLKGSCKGRLEDACRKVGYAGYRRVVRDNPREWEAFLMNGQHLSWDNSRLDSQKMWYGVSGYWHKLKDTGLDRCCLKSTNGYPPSEAFPLAADGLPYDGVVRLDADGYLADYDRIGFSDAKMQQFRSARVVAQYPIGTAIPPFQNSKTGVYAGGLVPGIEAAGGGLSSLVFLAGLFAAVRR